MAEWIGYACAGLAVLVFVIAGWRIGRDPRWTDIGLGVAAGASLTGAAIALVDPAHIGTLAYIPLALIAAMTLSHAASVDETEPDGDKNGS